ncbi:MAG: chromosome segregation protein SMC [Gammaproteobacteria bacterium]|nr:chromosome segregation protein SMC [Gammaproteobacteria bacterium]
MRLSKIKLAGFKSFVEPTTIQFPSNLTSIIGPNGCGKSNVIDAVRWVMGESSAKQLRGDSMDDVIFNGSTSRPPVSRASVDLVFDNSDHTLGGQYAQYSEIAIRREVTRDGQSNYYLNGTKCRRRDIADIFLGTGLGPRSYAIIEQGMISRIIDAKPEELRVYLEEAAGITKYKERRKETETRIRHTRENLERLNDLREEIAKQLTHLDRQARAAEKFKELKTEERRMKAELLALRWKVLDEKVQQDDQAIGEQQIKVEAVIAEQRHVEANIEKQREEQTVANDTLSKVQSEYYRLGAEISRIEQSIQHYKETRQRQQQDLQQIETAWRDAQQHIEDDKQRLEELSRDLAHKTPALTALKDTQQHSETSLHNAEKAMQDWQSEWERFNQDAARIQQASKVEATRLEQYKAQLQRLEQRKQRMLEEAQTLNVEPLIEQQEILLQQESRIHAELEGLEQGIETNNKSILLTREKIDQINKNLNEKRSESQSVRGKLASLEALQQAALGKQNTSLNQWLERRGLLKQPRVAEQLDVEKGWERAVETVLGSHLEAVCVDGFDDISGTLAELEKGALILLDRKGAARPAKSGTLGAKVRAPFDLSEPLNRVYAVETLQDALQMRAQLAEHESVITREGLWLGRNWLRVKNEDDKQGSVLTREQLIKSNKQKLDAFDEEIQNQEKAWDDAKNQLRSNEEERDTLQKYLKSINFQQTDVKTKLNSAKLQLEQQQNRRGVLEKDMAEIAQQVQQDQEQQASAQARLQEAEQQQAGVEQRQRDLQQKREQLTQSLSEVRKAAQADRDLLRELMVSIESMRSTHDSTDKNLSRMQQQVSHLQARRDELTAALSRGDEPIHVMEAELKEFLDQRVDIERALSDARAAVETLENEVRRLESSRAGLEQRVQELRSELEMGRLGAQENRVRCQTYKEQLSETGFETKLLFDEMPENATIDEWADQLGKMEQRIQRMGAINLAAIDEHKEQSERKNYLDAQNADLVDALETLEGAIAKIDKETRARFKEVFEKVNTQIGRMFPRLVGGGKAYLEMTGDDLLSTGVSIMAQPPGKRISNIHLLSGGEKAMTAVAMVFAIFQLNPAPFCMLDEVDAPLDEANVGRFSDMVREMSDKVQFIVITHNKTTMEMAEQLMGVTMREAGVSRIVAVDVEEAVKMTATS